MHDEHDIVAELRDSGGRLWSRVECDVKPNYIVVYARLWPHADTNIQRALAESEHLLKTVMERRLEGGRRWFAAVQWSERVCKTFAPERAGECVPTAECPPRAS